MGTLGFAGNDSTLKPPRVPGFCRLLTLYGLVIVLGVSLGYWSAREPSALTQIYFARVPSSPPDYDLCHNNLSEDQGHSLIARNVALIRERDPQDEVIVSYWSPQRANEWGSIELEFSWESDREPEFAALDPNLHISGQYDAGAEGEISVSSAATKNRWLPLATLGKSKSKMALQRPIDVTPWIRGSQSLKIRFRIKATRLMYHPTPNDPIGLAAAQCLREHRGTCASRLRIWNIRPKEP